MKASPQHIDCLYDALVIRAPPLIRLGNICAVTRIKESLKKVFATRMNEFAASKAENSNGPE